MSEPVYTEFASRAIELSKIFTLFCATPALPRATGAYAIE